MAWQSMRLIFLLCFSPTLGTNVHEQCQFDIHAAKQAAKATSEFSWKLFSKLSKPDQNLIYSPVSISLALALLQSGTSGATFTELQQHLNPPGSNQSDPSHFYESLQSQLQVKGGDKLSLNIANGFFYSQDLTVKQEFINRTKHEFINRCFDTQVEKVQFKTNSEQVRRHVNQWISDKTAHEIPELFKQGMISAQTVAVLANAFYLKALWKERFQTGQNLPFYKLGGPQAQTVPFMTLETRTSYAENSNMQLVEIPYNGGLSMYVVLPKQRDGQRSLTSANKKNIRRLGRSVTWRKVNLKIPKFTIRTSVNLKDVLEKLGISKIFSAQADFSKLSNQPLMVNSAVHEAYIKVDENGTEAAAATGFGIRQKSARPRETAVEFKADHPFSFAIVHNPTKAALFVGKVVKIDHE